MIVYDCYYCDDSYCSYHSYYVLIIAIIVVDITMILILVYIYIYIFIVISISLTCRHVSHASNWTSRKTDRRSWQVKGDEKTEPW